MGPLIEEPDLVVRKIKSVVKSIGRRAADWNDVDR